MIKSLTINNFKSFNNADLQIKPLTLLIGANASGKSNALEAIRLLSWLAKGIRLDDIERNIQETDSPIRGQSNDLFNDINRNIQLKCELSICPKWYNNLYLEIRNYEKHLILAQESILQSPVQQAFGLLDLPLYDIDSSPNPHTDEIRVKYNNFKKGKNKPLIPCSNRQAIFYQLETPARFNNSDKESQEIIPIVTKSFRDALRSIMFLDPKPSLMHGYSYINGNILKEDGSNLSSVLYSVQENTEEIGNKTCKEYLLNFVRSLPEQDIKEIRFIKTERNDVMVRLVESFGDQEREFDAPLLSDGTLRVLAVAAVLLSAPPYSLVIIEEIDNGIHPSRADQLLQNIKEIAELRKLQVLLTSHNPALLDALPDQCLGDVLCCYRDPQEGDSRIVKLETLPRYPELVAQGSLGYLMTQGVLDRFLKDKTTPEQQKKSALEWLKNLKAEVSA